jgi:hypothetical protein
MWQMMRGLISPPARMKHPCPQSTIVRNVPESFSNPAESLPNPVDFETDGASDLKTSSAMAASNCILWFSGKNRSKMRREHTLAEHPGAKEAVDF